MTTALRSFLRFARYRGDIDKDLAACVPAVANWKLSTIPRALPPCQVERVLTSIDRGTAMGRYAGDVYYSGGAYYFSTLAAAEFCFRAALKSPAVESLVARGDAAIAPGHAAGFAGDRNLFPARAVTYRAGSRGLRLKLSCHDLLNISSMKIPLFAPRRAD